MAVVRFRLSASTRLADLCSKSCSVLASPRAACAACSTSLCHLFSCAGESSRITSQLVSTSRRHQATAFFLTTGPMSCESRGGGCVASLPALSVAGARLPNMRSAPSFEKLQCIFHYALNVWKRNVHSSPVYTDGRTGNESPTQLVDSAMGRPSTVVFRQLSC